MKQIGTDRNRKGNRTVAAFTSVCRESCHKVLEQVRQAKEALFAQSRNAFQRQERLLRLALNEAEALAWQTMYPHLLFPVLAAEKVQALADWSAHQRLVRHADPITVLSA
jgi:hypothetical protein